MKVIICARLLSLCASSFAGQRQQQQNSQQAQKAPNPNANQHSQTLDIQYEIEGIEDEDNTAQRSEQPAQPVRQIQVKTSETESEA